MLGFVAGGVGYISERSYRCILFRQSGKGRPVHRQLLAGLVLLGEKHLLPQSLRQSPTPCPALERPQQRGFGLTSEAWHQEPLENFSLGQNEGAT